MAPRRPHEDHQSRELLLSGRQGELTDTALLSVLVGEQVASGVRRLVSPQELPGALWRVHPEELISLNGIGPAGAARLLACVEMSRRASLPSPETRPTVTTPEDVVSVCAPVLRGRDREYFLSLALTTKNRLIRVIEVSVGSLNASIVHPRELFKDAVRLSAASVVVVHNHPSGDPTPSGADIQLTRRLVKAGDVLGVDVLDHVIIGDGGEHASMRDLGLM